jgi:hypothetical protein
LGGHVLAEVVGGNGWHVAAGTESGPFQVLRGQPSTIADLLSGRELTAHGGCLSAQAVLIRH